MTTTPQAALLPINYFDVQQAAETYGLDYNKLGCAVRDILAKLQAATPAPVDQAIALASEAGGLTGWGTNRRRSDPELSGTDWVFGEEDLRKLITIAQRPATPAEPAQAGSASLLDGCKSVMDSIAVSSSVIEHNKQEPVQAGELPPPPTLSDDERQWLHYNPNTSDIEEWVYGYAVAYARAALSARKPFTNAQIERLFYNSNRGNGCASLAAFVRVVRLVESAHGIGLEVKP